MQAIILAAGRGYRLNRLTENNTKCMVKINGISLIERMLRQVDKLDFERIVIVDGYQHENLEEHICSLDIQTKIEYVYNKDYLETNNIYSLYLAKDYLCKSDSVIIESGIIFEEEILRNIVSDTNENIAAIDIYKCWMTGQGVQLNLMGEIESFLKENEMDHNSIRLSYKTIGLYKFSACFFKEIYLPFLIAYIDVYGENAKYEQVLSVLMADGRAKINTYLVGENSWYEINDIQDIDLASTLFSDDEERVTEAMLGRWGGIGGIRNIWISFIW